MKIIYHGTAEATKRIGAGVAFTVPFSATLAMVARVDATSTGKTWFSPVQNNQVQSEFGTADYSKTERDAFTLVNARLGVRADTGDVTAWSRNIGNKQYLAEFDPRAGVRRLVRQFRNRARVRGRGGVSLPVSA